MYSIKLFIPCEVEERGEKHQTEYDKIEKIQSNNVILNSPIIQINKLDNTKLFPEYQSVDKILESCHLSSLKRYHFIIDSIAAPYGVVLSTTVNSYKEMKGILTNTQNDFFPCSPFPKEGKRRPYWIVYDCLIILVEYAFHNRASQVRFRKKTQEDHLYTERIKFGQNHICVKDNVVLIDTYKTSVNDALYDVLNVYMAINQLWSRIRIEGKKLGSDSEWKEKDKREKLIQIHEMCAVFAEMMGATIFHNYLQRKIFDFLYSHFRIEEKNDQVLGAKEYADYLVAENVNKRASSINTIAFVTGYIGILLAFFAFFPLELKDIFWIQQPIPWNCKVVIYLLIAIGFALASWGLTCLYSVYSNWKHKNKNKWLFFALLAIGMVLFILLKPLRFFV